MVRGESIARRAMATGLPGVRPTRKFNDPLREVPEIRQQIGAKTRKRDMRRGENQHHAEQKQVHEIDHHERKKCALIAQVRLIFQDHPACEGKMKRPRCANDRVKQLPVRLHVYDKIERAVDGDRENAVEREKIRCQCDPEVGFACDDVSSFATNAKPADASPHHPNPERMSKLVSENIDYDWARKTEERDHPKHCAQ